MGWKYLVIVRMGSGKLIARPIAEKEKLDMLIKGMEAQGFSAQYGLSERDICKACDELNRMRYAVVTAPGIS